MIPRSSIVTETVQKHESAYIGAPTRADAILDRLVLNSHRVIPKSNSMRKLKRTAEG